VLSGKRLEQFEENRFDDKNSRLNELGQVEDEETYNRGLIIELHNQREEINERKERFLRERREEELRRERANRR
jgi:hypothetical protein